ncbi:putative Diguanylate cyclase [uncultured Desulfobacterium sp.]|uniref:diguanylate cyclase n=1 Tax=uncultured Desulfobacterium sp. TaxID=201089 RepID=A0A445N216_9BACT|nr:putative Diguanylate cyclase [uncultured Desulfobacterium sp.]
MAAHVDEKEIKESVKMELSRALEECKNRLEFFQTAFNALNILIKEFSLDLREINADGFMDELDRLAKKILSDEKAKKLPAHFEKQKKLIFSYIERLKKYLYDRENELKDIIDLLTKAMATLDTDNQVFNQEIYQQSERIEKITLLDDIKKVKSALQHEVARAREAVKNKQKSDSQRMEMLSRQVSSLNTELEKARLESQTDGLTGVYNRMAFDRYIKNLEEKNNITNAPFSLLLIDIDNFKQINDTYGHQIGDRVILALIQKCKEITRRDDHVSRLGGDEFAIIMEGASFRNASKKAKKLTKEIANTRYAVATGYDSFEVSFTISIGVSTFRKGDTVATITERADKALYAAKSAGKSRVVSEKELR